MFLPNMKKKKKRGMLSDVIKTKIKKGEYTNKLQFKDDVIGSMENVGIVNEAAQKIFRNAWNYAEEECNPNQDIFGTALRKTETILKANI